MDNVEFLCTDAPMQWVAATAPPPNAVQGGNEGGTPLHVARTNHDGKLICGKWHPEHGLFIPFGGAEMGCGMDNVEFLCTCAYG
eukprot:COSAG01_NODE_51422_length_355_cov_0.585938_1_plen_84_part_00